MRPKRSSSVGLNSGTVVAGSMGGGAELDYTVIGDAVNVAARVKSLTRRTGDTILLTEATLASLSQLPDDLQSRGSIRVKGRTQETAVYAVQGTSSRRLSSVKGTLAVTGDPEADELLNTDLLALLIGMMLDQHMR